MKRNISNSLKQKLIFSVFSIVFSMAIIIMIISKNLFDKSFMLFKESLYEKSKLTAQNISDQASLGISMNDKDKLNSIIKKYKTEKDISYIAIINTKKEVLSNFGDKGFRERIHSIDDITSNKTFEDKRHFCSIFSVTLESQKIGYVLVGINFDRIINSKRIQLMYIIILFSGVLCIAFISTYIFAQKFIAPILTISKFAEGISKGNLDDKLEIKTQDEIGFLAETFNNMTGRLKDFYNEIESWGKNLEKIVELRTDELKNVNIKLEKANKAKSEFLANMSHEIRTPMNGIIGLTDLMITSDLSLEQLQYLTMVKNSADQLLNLINDILDFSKIEAGQLDLEKIEFDLYSTAENISDIFIHRTQEKGIEFNIFIQNEVPIHLIGDPGRLRQILVNLVSNAIKFTEKGGIDVKVKLDQIIENNAIIHFSIKDTGIGIKPEKQDAIFKSFSQADSSTTRKFGGTGLGLTICKQLAELMGGKIWVKSKPDFGSTFHFTAKFPVQSELKSKQIKIPKNLHGLRVLIVDDTKMNQLVLTEMLKSISCQVITADNGLDALEVLKEESNFHLILTDYLMPYLNGIELILKIQKDKKLSNIPLILLMSIDRNKTIEQLDTIENIQILTKPIKRISLFNAMGKALGLPQEVYNAQSTNSFQITDYISKLSQFKKEAHLLLAEDNIINQRLANALISKTGIPVDVVNDGEIAINKLKDNKYDLILMDVQMPNMDGLTATRKIREQLQNENIPIIAMTAHAMKGDKEKCLSVGMNDYISKPIEPEKLYKVLYNWLKEKPS